MFSAFDLCREGAFREFLAAVLRAAEENDGGPLTLPHILLKLSPRERRPSAVASSAVVKASHHFGFFFFASNYRVITIDRQKQQGRFPRAAVDSSENRFKPTELTCVPVGSGQCDPLLGAVGAVCWLH